MITSSSQFFDKFLVFWTLKHILRVLIACTFLWTSSGLPASQSYSLFRSWEQQILPVTSSLLRSKVLPVITGWKYGWGGNPIKIFKVKNELCGAAQVQKTTVTLMMVGSPVNPYHLWKAPCGSTGVYVWSLFKSTGRIFSSCRLPLGENVSSFILVPIEESRKVFSRMFVHPQKYTEKELS